MALPAKLKQTAASEFRASWQLMGGEVQAALPPHIPLERFMRVVLTATNSNPDLLRADRRSLFQASMQAAQDGLLPDGREGALVVYKTKKKDGTWVEKVQWMPMIGGILKRIRNSGELATITANVARENDLFDYELGDNEFITHKPAKRNRGAPTHAYAIAKTKDGGIYRAVMDMDDIERVRQISRMKDKGAWVDWWDGMAEKTVLRRLAKRLPISSDLDDLLRRDDALYDFDRHDARPSPVANPLSDIAPQPCIDAPQEVEQACLSTPDPETGQNETASTEPQEPAKPPRERGREAQRVAGRDEAAA